MAEAAILRRLAERAGPSKMLRFDHFMEVVLYDPHVGYYAQPADRVGRQGDFLTNVELGDLFGACVAQWLHRAWLSVGRGPFQVLELGAGAGRLANAVWTNAPDQQFQKDLRFHLVERGPAARAAHARLPLPVESHASLDEVPAHLGVGALVAHELFDNLPTRRVMRADGWKEIVVRLNGNRLREDLVEAPPDLRELVARLGVRLREGQSAEVCAEAEPLLARALSRLDRGRLLVVDYGGEADELYGDRHPQGTLATYRGHAPGGSPYDHLGEQDVTAHVNFTPLRRAAEAFGFKTQLVTQSRFLIDNGLADVVARRLERETDELAKLRLTQWARILYHPDAWGERFQVLTGNRD